MNKKVKGFTLIEAMLSVALFGIAMLILFGAANTFFKAWKKHDAKQNAHRELVKIYSSINREFSLTNTGFFSYYKAKDAPEHLSDKRWFLFPVPTDQDNTYQCDGDGAIYWTRIMIYYLLRPENDSCSSAECCPHKSLIKTSYYFKSPVSLSYGDETPLDILISRVSEVLLRPGSNFPEIDGLTFLGSRTLAQDIFDISVTFEKKGRADFGVKIVRIEEAQKAVGVGKTDFTSKNGARYIESLSWKAFAK